MKRRVVFVSVVVVLVLLNIASADMVQGINMDFVTIGNAGNVADSTGFAAVAYNFSIGKYEITNGQWNAFAAAVGMPTGNPSYAYNQIPTVSEAGTNLPTSNVSWVEAAQFCNYLTSGDKSLGADLFSSNFDFLGIDRASARTDYDVIYVLPTEDGWYKAAYFKPDGSGYSTYAMAQIHHHQQVKQTMMGVCVGVLLFFRHYDTRMLFLLGTGPL